MTIKDIFVIAQCIIDGKYNIPPQQIYYILFICKETKRYKQHYQKPTTSNESDLYLYISTLGVLNYTFLGLNFEVGILEDIFRHTYF